MWTQTTTADALECDNSKVTLNPTLKAHLFDNYFNSDEFHRDAAMKDPMPLSKSIMVPRVVFAVSPFKIWNKE